MTAPRLRLLWWIIAGAAAGAGALFVLVVDHLSAPGHHLPFLLIVALFALAEMAVVPIRVGSRDRSYSLVAVPLVLGLVAIRPEELAGAWLAGGAIALALWRRQSPVKLAYNVAAFAFQSVAAVLVFRAITDGRNIVAGRTFLAVVAACLVASLISTGSVMLAVALTERGPYAGEGRARSLAYGAAATLVIASTTLVGVVLQETDPASLWLLAVPVAGVYLAQREFTTKSVRNVPVPAPEEVSVPEQLESAATRDVLTGLADRSLVTAHLAQLLEEPGESEIACLFIDLDDFAAVNDRFGPATGDQLLVVTAQRLAGCLRGGDLAGRWGGDQLAVIAHVRPDDDISEATALGQRIVAALSRPASLGAETVFSSASIGIALGSRGDSADDVVAAAGSALRLAKEDGKGRVEVFEPDRRRHGAPL